MPPGRYDAVVAGASLAGCATAILLARLGLSVALVEQRPDVDAYKVACTHFIQASATPTIRRLGLDAEIEAAGAVRNGFDLWTRWGWVRAPAQLHGPGPGFGYSIRRETLDPLLRRNAMETASVTTMLGQAVVGVDLGQQTVSIRLAAPSGEERRLEASLLVGADGRSSSVARLSGLPARSRPNNRFAYWAYYRDLVLPGGSRGTARFWHLDPDVAYALPNDDGLTLMVVMPSKARLPEFRRDLNGSFERLAKGLPDPASFSGAERVSSLRGRVDAPNLRRPPAGHRLALVGDAALTCDPMPGVGCGWALQSAEWLAESVALADGDPGVAVRAYAARHRAVTAHDYGLISRMSRAQPASLWERLLIEAATRDEGLAARLMAHWQRRITLADYLTPSTLTRSAAVIGEDMASRVRASRASAPFDRHLASADRPCALIWPRGGCKDRRR